MKFTPTTYTLKSGKQITIRTPKVSEAKASVELKRSYIANTTTLPLTLEDYPLDINKESKLIRDYHLSANSIILVAEYQNTLIGNIDLTGNKRSKMAHTAMLGMGIQEEWRNQGLGRALIECALDWAKRKSSLEIIWLNVYASNRLGFHLYQKMGFEVSGIVKDFFKTNEGYEDKIHMYLQIK